MTEALSIRRSHLRRAPWNKGKISERSRRSAPSMSGLSDKAPGQRSCPRSCSVQSCYGQQASRLRRRGTQDRMSLHRAAMPMIRLPFGRGRRAARSSFELTEATRQAVDDYVKATGKSGATTVHRSRRLNGSLTTRQYARLLAEWIASVVLDPHLFGTHSLRRTKATLIYRRTGAICAPYSSCWDTRKSRAL